MSGNSAALALLFAISVIAVDAPVVHDHEDGAPAWYNEECPLSRLALGVGDRDTHRLSLTGDLLGLLADDVVQPHANPSNVPPALVRARAPPSRS